MNLRAFSFAFLLSFGVFAGPEPKVVVSRPRIFLGDVLERASLLIAGIDLGPAPAPGGTRVFSRDEIEMAMRRAGASPNGLAIPATIRVESAAVRTSADDLATLLRPAIAKQLTTGIALVKIEPMGELLLPPRAQLQTVTIPKAPRIRGNFRTAAVAEFTLDGAVVARTAVPVTLDVTEDAVRPDALRGTHVALVADVGAVQITTSAVLLSDARIGDTVSAQVSATNRVVRVRLTRPDTAHVAESL